MAESSNPIAMSGQTASRAPTNLSSLLDAESVVIIGASSNFTRLGGIPIKRLLDGGFPRERLLLVNPKYKDIANLPCYPDIASLPWVPELAVLAVSADQSLDALDQCHKLGIRAATLFASGFGEEDTPEGQSRQRSLVAFVSRTGMVVAGPNCLGHASFRTHLFPTFLKDLDRQTEPGPLAIVGQSGNVTGLLRQCGVEAGLRFSYAVSTGNEACVGLNDYLEHFLQDPATRAVVGYIEQVRDGRRFLDVATRLRDAGKALFLLRAGNSEKGAQAVASHTGAMGGSRAAYEAAFAQLNVGTATDPHRLIDLVSLWSTGKHPSSRRACIVSLSGATGALLADHVSDVGIELPVLAAATQEGLRAVVPSYGAVCNPVDLTGQALNNSASIDAALDLIAADPGYEVAVFYAVSGLLDKMAPALIRMARDSKLLVVVVDPSRDSTCHTQLREGNVPVFTDMNRLAAALSGFLSMCARAGMAWRPRTFQDAQEAASPGLPAGMASLQGKLLDEVQAKDLLRRAGLPMVEEQVVQSPERASAVAAQLGGPVALKIVSPDIPHKSDIGAVHLNAVGDAQVREAFAAVMAAAHKRPDARIEGVVVQPMVTSGQQILVGVVRDATFGHIMTVGLGGVMTELFGDVSRRLLPVRASDAQAMLHELKGYALLDGFRGAPRSDIDALARLMVAVSDYVELNSSWIEELELNPVMVRSDGAGVCAVDALIRVA